MKAPWHSADSSLLKSWNQGVRWGHNGKTIFTCVYNGKNIQAYSQEFNQTYSSNYSLVKRIQACTNKGQGHHQWKDNYKNTKYIGIILISSQETHDQKNTDLHESFLTVLF